MTEQTDERWFRVMLRRGSQTSFILALGANEGDAERTVREEIPLYETEISWIEPVNDRRVVAL
jgi:hypothetical protein